MSPKTQPDPDVAEEESKATFNVHLENFSGPFDLLLSLIAKHKLDVTEVALAVVTDDFLAYIRAQEQWDLSQASEFLVIGATLLDLKTARLLPGSTTDEIEDLELLEARDLLFARLLQYRAFKEASVDIAARMETASLSFARDVPLESEFANLLPELIMSVEPAELAVLAARAISSKPAIPQVNLDHLHGPTVSVSEQAAHISDLLRRRGRATFRQLTADAPSTLVVVARFLALLELYRQKAVSFDQAGPLAELSVHWTAAVEDDIEIADEYDDSLAAATNQQ